MVSKRPSDHGNGFVKMFRKSLTSAVFNDPITWKIWCWCLMRANYEPVPLDFDGKQISVERGQFVTGSYSMYGELEIPKTTIWRHLHKLESWGNIVMKVGYRYTVITVCNYESYQIPNSDNGTIMERRWNEDGTKMGTDKEVKKQRSKEDIARPENLESVKAFFVDNRSNPTEAEKFYDHFSSNGWRVGGKTAMKDWRAAARNWIRNVPTFKGNATPARQNKPQSSLPIIRCSDCGTEHDPHQICPKCNPEVTGDKESALKAIEGLAQHFQMRTK